MPITAAALDARLDKSSVFPRLEVVQQLESVFLKDPRTPSDVQVLCKKIADKNMTCNLMCFLRLVTLLL